MTDEKLRILLPMEPHEDGTDALRLLEAMFSPEDVVLRRLYVYRPAQLDQFVPEMYASMPELQRLNDEAEAAAVAESAKSCELFRASGYEIESAVMPGVPTAEILDDARRWGAKLLMVRAARGSIADQRIGSLTAALMYHAEMPLLVYRYVRPEVAVGRVLVPTDLSRNAHQAADWGVAIANALGAEADLLYIAIPHRWEDQRLLCDEALREAEKWLERARPLLKVRADAHVHSAASVPAGVVTFAKTHGADLLVISAHGRSAAAAALVGANARRIVRESTLPVLVIPAKNAVARNDVVQHVLKVAAVSR